MSVRYICDGCAKDLGEKVGEVTVSITREVLETYRYHLCSRCEALLREQANPKHWARINK